MHQEEDHAERPLGIQAECRILIAARRGMRELGRFGVDATRAVLSLDLDRIAALEDGTPEAASLLGSLPGIPEGAVVDVSIVDALEDFFDVWCLSELGQSELDDARAAAGVEAASQALAA